MRNWRLSVWSIHRLVAIWNIMSLISGERTFGIFLISNMLCLYCVDIMSSHPTPSHFFSFCHFRQRLRSIATLPILFLIISPHPFAFLGLSVSLSLYIGVNATAVRCNHSLHPTPWVTTGFDSEDPSVNGSSATNAAYVGTVFEEAFFGLRCAPKNRHALVDPVYFEYPQVLAKTIK